MPIREAAALACYASLATRVDSTLLRRLRLNLVQRASASAEADLWFSDLSESRDGESLVLDPGVAAVLRERLASQFLADGRSALEVAFEHTVPYTTCGRHRCGSRKSSFTWRSAIARGQPPRSSGFFDRRSPRWPPTSNAVSRCRAGSCARCHACRQSCATLTPPSR